jgi:hypothetical protein
MNHTALTTYRAILAAAAAPAEPGRVRIPTSDRGCMLLQRDPVTLQRWAELVLKNWALYGGGPRPAEIAKPARKIGAAWSASAVQVWREQIEIGQHADAARLGLEKLGARFYLHRAGQPFCLVAPKPVQGMPAFLVSGRRDDGKWIVFDIVSGQGVRTAGEPTRASAEKWAAREWSMRSADQQATALRIARREHTGTQSAALAAWCELHQIDPADIPAALPDVAAADVDPAPAQDVQQVQPAPAADVVQPVADAAPVAHAAAPVPCVIASGDPAPWRGPANSSARARVYAVHVRTNRTACDAVAGWPTSGVPLRRMAGGRLDPASRQLRQAVAAAVLAARASSRAAPVQHPAAPVAAHPRLADALQVLAAAVRPAGQDPARDAPTPATPATLDPAPRPALAALVAELDQITQAARDRMHTGGQVLDAARLAAGPVLAGPDPAARPGLVRPAAAGGPAGADPGGMRPGTYPRCSDIGAAAAAARPGPGQPARPGFAPAWGARPPAGAFAGGPRVLAGIPCGDISAANRTAWGPARPPGDAQHHNTGWTRCGPAAHHIGASAGHAARIRHRSAHAWPPPVATSAHHLVAAGRAAARIQPFQSHTGPPRVATSAR